MAAIPASNRRLLSRPRRHLIRDWLSEANSGFRDVTLVCAGGRAVAWSAVFLGRGFCPLLGKALQDISGKIQCCGTATVLLPDFSVSAVRKMLDLISTGKISWKREENSVIAELRELLKVMGVDKSVFGKKEADGTDKSVFGKKDVDQTVVEKADKNVVKSGFELIRALYKKNDKNVNKDHDVGKNVFHLNKSSFQAGLTRREVVDLESDDHDDDSDSVTEVDDQVDREEMLERQREERRERLSRRQRQRDQSDKDADSVLASTRRKQKKQLQGAEEITNAEDSSQNVRQQRETRQSFDPSKQHVKEKEVHQQRQPPETDPHREESVQHQEHHEQDQRQQQPHVQPPQQLQPQTGQDQQHEELLQRQNHPQVRDQQELLQQQKHPLIQDQQQQERSQTQDQHQQEFLQQNPSDAILVALDPNSLRPEHHSAWPHHDQEEITFVSDVNLVEGEEVDPLINNSISIDDDITQSPTRDGSEAVDLPQAATAISASAQVGQTVQDAEVFQAANGVNATPQIDNEAFGATHVGMKVDQEVDLDEDPSRDDDGAHVIGLTGNAAANSPSIAIDSDTDVNGVGLTGNDAANSPAIAIESDSVRAIAAESFDTMDGESATETRMMLATESFETMDNGDSASDSGMLSCFRCPFKHGDRQGMLEHLCRQHFRNELLQSLQLSMGNKCGLCGDVQPDRESLLIHVGAFHATVLGFLPEGAMTSLRHRTTKQQQRQTLKQQQQWKKRPQQQEQQLMEQQRQQQQQKQMKKLEEQQQWQQQGKEQQQHQEKQQQKQELKQKKVKQQQQHQEQLQLQQEQQQQQEKQHQEKQQQDQKHKRKRGRACSRSPSFDGGKRRKSSLKTNSSTDEKDEVGGGNSVRSGSKAVMADILRRRSRRMRKINNKNNSIDHDDDVGGDGDQEKIGSAQDTVETSGDQSGGGGQDQSNEQDVSSGIRRSENVKESSNNNPYQKVPCPRCNCVPKVGMLVHISSHFHKELRELTGDTSVCPECDKDFQSRSCLARHFGSKHKKVLQFLSVRERAVLKSLKGSKSFKGNCPVCKNPPEQGCMLWHLSKHFHKELKGLVGDTTVCPECGKESVNTNVLAQHYGGKHRKVLQFLTAEQRREISIKVDDERTGGSISSGEILQKDKESSNSSGSDRCKSGNDKCNSNKVVQVGGKRGKELCPVCQRPLWVTGMLNHVSDHFSAKLENLVGDTTTCPECGRDCGTRNKVATHYGSKHKKVLHFLNPAEWKALEKILGRNA